MPNAEEINAAIEQWRAAEELRQAAALVEQEARAILVDVLKRAGLRGLVL